MLLCLNWFIVFIFFWEKVTVEIKIKAANKKRPLIFTFNLTFLV